ncbi:MAG: xanthine dehydrogenase family protein molybdopterin-binding subunit [Pseudomonadota bacterium]
MLPSVPDRPSCAPVPAPRRAVIGRSCKRREDRALVTGHGQFTADVPLDGALQVAFVRSDVAKGRIAGIACDAASSLPGVVAVLTAADLPALRGPSVNPVLELSSMPQFQVLARDRISAVGQPVAAVLATGIAAAADAAAQVVVDIVDGDDDAAPAGDTGATGDSSIAVRGGWRQGDAAALFAEADHVVCVTVQHPRLAACSLEPRSVAVDVDRDSGALTVWLSTQTPHRARTDLAHILGLDAHHVHVIAPDVGGAFGMKASLYPEEIFVVWAALHTGRPVRWNATRSEDMLSASHGRGGRLSGRLAIGRNGRFLALSADFEMPLGAWLTTSAAVPSWNAGRILPGPYAVDCVDIAVRGILCATAPVGIYRGAGRPEAAMLMERLVHEAARVLDRDPLDLRAQNLVPPTGMPHRGATGTVLDSGDYPRLVRRFRDYSDYDALCCERDRRRQNGSLVGIGTALFVEPCGRGWESARVEWRPDGTALLATGSSSQGHGRETAYAQIVADALDIEPDRVTVAEGDTELCPNGIGALASRSTAIGGSAVLEAAREVRAKRDRAGPENAPENSIVAETVFQCEHEAWGSGLHLAMVSIDPDTGTLTVERFLCVDDIGTVINPMLAEGQLSGGLAQGLGEALLEKVVYDADGQLLTGSLMDYAMPRAADMPDIGMASQATPAPFNLLGAKGIGEAGTIGAPAAILNAALDALSPLGVRELDMPLTGAALWTAIQSARQGGSA